MEIVGGTQLRLRGCECVNMLRVASWDLEQRERPTRVFYGIWLQCVSRCVDELEKGRSEIREPLELLFARPNLMRNQRARRMQSLTNEAGARSETAAEGCVDELDTKSGTRWERHCRRCKIERLLGGWKIAQTNLTQSRGAVKRFKEI